MGLVEVLNAMNILKKVKEMIFSTKPTGSFSCSVCDSEKLKMQPLSLQYFANYHKYGLVHNIFRFETLNLLNYNCPHCYSNDRDRLYALYIKEFVKGKNSVSFLDIAPGAQLANFIKKLPNTTYRSTDLHMDNVDDKLDITNLHLYKENQFDFFICSHVLEHIPDDIAAMKELHRVLKKGGEGIAMVPIPLDTTEFYEDINEVDIGKRWKYFGQDDHLRMYTKEIFIQRLQIAGFTVKELGMEYFGKETFDRYAIFPTSTLYIVTK